MFVVEIRVCPFSSSIIIPAQSCSHMNESNRDINIIASLKVLHVYAFINHIDIYHHFLQSSNLHIKEMSCV